MIKNYAIYAEWMLYREFFNDIFSSWEEFHKATFCPDIDIITIKVIK